MINSKVLLINDDENNDIILNKNNNNIECINTFNNIILDATYYNLKFINIEKENIIITINKLQPKLKALSIFNCELNLNDISLLPKLKLIECNSNILKKYNFNNIEELTTENININFNELPKTIKRLTYHIAKEEEIKYYNGNIDILTISIQHNKKQLLNIKNINLLDIIICDNIYKNKNNKLNGIIENINELIIESGNKEINIIGLDLKNIKDLKLINTKLYLRKKLNCNIQLKNSKIIYLT